MIDKELIEQYRKTVKPVVASWLFNINYEHMGERDKEEFERDFDKILDLALIGLKYKAQLSQEGTTKDATSDTIYRQVAIDVVDPEIVSTNPEHFKSSEKFIKFMDDADIASFGKWQWANGFNTAVVAIKVQLKKLPYAQSERSTGHWILRENRFPWSKVYKCSECGNYINLSDINAGRGSANFCPNCGAKMEERHG